MRQSLNDGLLGYVTGRRNRTADQGDELARLLAANDFDGFVERLRSFFAGIPYQWRGGNGPARHEAWYAGMLYACFRTIGLDLRVEDSSSRGRADMVVLHGDQVFVLEFKMADGEDDRDAAVRQAIEQTRERGYADKYQDRGEPIHLIGIACGRDGSPAAVRVVTG